VRRGRNGLEGRGNECKKWMNGMDRGHLICEKGGRVGGKGEMKIRKGGMVWIWIAKLRRGGNRRKHNTWRKSRNIGSRNGKRGEGMECKEYVGRGGSSST